MHAFLLVLLVGGVPLGVLIVVYYLLGGRNAPTGDGSQRRKDEIRAEVNRHPRSNLPRHW